MVTWGPIKTAGSDAGHEMGGVRLSNILISFKWCEEEEGRQFHFSLFCFVRSYTHIARGKIVPNN